MSNIRIYLDLVGMFYCVERCKNRGLLDVLRTELFRESLRNAKRVTLILVWDKNVEYGGNIRKFLEDIVGSLTTRTLLYKSECNQSSKRCGFVVCDNHEAYCCMCDATGGDILVSVRANAKIRCDDKELDMRDGVTNHLGCKDLNCPNCEFVVCYVEP